MTFPRKWPWMGGLKDDGAAFYGSVTVCDGAIQTQ